MTEFSAMLSELYETIIRPIEDFLANNHFFVITVLLVLLIYFFFSLFRDDRHRNRFTVLVSIFGIAFFFLFGEGLMNQMVIVEEQADQRILETIDETSLITNTLLEKADLLHQDGYALSEDDAEYATPNDLRTLVGYVVVTYAQPAQIHEAPYGGAPSIGEVHPAQLIECYGVEQNAILNTSWYLVMLETGERGYLAGGRGQLYVKAQAAPEEEPEELLEPESLWGRRRLPRPPFG